MKIKNNEILGDTFYTSRRYNYSAIDKILGNSQSEASVIAGMTKKEALNFLSQLRDTQSDSFDSLLVAITFGASQNSDELYLYATNDREIYDLYFKPSLVCLKHYLDVPDHVKQANDVLEIVWNVKYGFFRASERYKAEFPEDTKTKIFTQLDFSVCTHQWIEFYKGEYKVNGLAGY